MKREVFRKEALDRLSSPDQLDSLMPVTSSRAWVALAGIGLILLMGLIWGIAGTVETKVDGNGLLMRHDGFQLVKAPHAGKIAGIQVNADNSVKAGDLLLTLAASKGSSPPTEVRAPIAGRVLDTRVISGSAVDADDSLLSIETPEAPLQAVVYVSATNGFKVEPGMDVRIRPATATRQGEVFLRGRVKSVARFPVTRDHLMFSLQNEEWVNDLLRVGPALEVVIDIPSEAPLDELYSGTPCDASIIIAKQRPIHFLLPSADN